MSSFTPQQLKKALIEAGFEVFRTRGNEVVLAERVRENLIMDSGVRLVVGAPLQVAVVMLAKRNDFPNEEEGQIFERVRELASEPLGQGFVEIQTHVAPQNDPVDSTKTLDVFYELTVARSVGELSDAFDLLKYALGLDKTAGCRRASDG